MKKRLFVICTVFVVVGLLLSCNDSKKYKINNTQEWVDFVSSASGVEEIDKCFMNMSPRQIVNIFEEMVPMIVHITTEELHAKSKCRAFMWLLNGIGAHSERFTPEQYSQITSVNNGEMALRICHVSIGSEEDEITKTYADYILGKK